MVSRYSTGDLPGSEQALIQLFRAWRPGVLGIPFIAPSMMLSLPYGEWHEYASIENANGSLTAGQGTREILYTVPEDRRQWLEYVFVDRATGDNTFSDIGILPVEGYRVGSTVAVLILLGTAATSIWWPTDANQANVTRAVVPTRPLMLEPGTALSLLPSGAGVAGSNVTIQLFLRSTPLTRALTPF